MEINISENMGKVNEAFIVELKKRLGDDEHSPNWEQFDSLTIGFAYGANSWNAILWQGQKYWKLGDDIFKYQN